MDKSITKKGEISRAFKQYANQSNLINIEFKMLENKLCTLVYDFRWITTAKESKVNEPLMSLLLRFWDRKPSSLSSHVLKSFYNESCFYPHFICENYINSILIFVHFESFNITHLATKVHMILRGHILLTWMRDKEN